VALRIPEEKISEIRNAADIVEVISDTVLLKKTGKNFIGLCPFHTEKTPSFTVNPDKQIFYCFGCSAGGNVYSFVMKHEGMTFPEAARALAKRFGVELPEPRMSTEQRRRLSEREVLLGVNRRAMGFFKAALQSENIGKTARAYLNRRGMREDIVEGFQLGYAPDGWDHLLKHLNRSGSSSNYLEKAGLVIRRKSGTGFYDRFRNRIIFPIMDASGRVTGFGGRVMDDSLPKYLNSPETPVYNKSRTLYGLYQAKSAIRSSGSVFIVEGYFDVLALHQHGILNAVATCGTSITTEHVQLLRGYIGKNGRVFLVYDSDAAGIKAAQRSISIFDQGFVDARILVLPTGHDPDSYLFESGAEAFGQLADNARGAVDFLIESAVKRYGLRVEGKMKIISELRHTLAAVEDQLARSLYIQTLADRIGVDESAILERVREVTEQKALSYRKSGKPSATNQRSAGDANAAPKPLASAGRGARHERRILAMMLQFPDILPEVNRRHIISYFADPMLRTIGEMIVKHPELAGKNLSDLMNRFDDPVHQQFVASLAVKEESWNFKDGVKLLANFIKISPNRREKTLVEKIREAEQANDHELLIRLLSERQQLAVSSEKEKMELLRFK